jgi:hypothetical protein
MSLAKNPFRLAIQLAVVVSLAFCNVIWADDTDIQVDSVSETTSTSSSYSWSHTVGSGDSRYLIVSIAILGSSTSSPAVTVSSVTFGTAAMEVIGVVDSGTNCRAEQWQLIAPSTGTYTISVTLSTAAPTASYSLSLFNVHQTYPRRSDAGSGATSGDAEVSASSRYRDLAVDVLAVKGVPGVTAGDEQTLRSDQTSGTSPNNLRGAGSTLPGGSRTVTAWWTIDGGASPWAQRIAVLQPVGPPDLARVRRMAARLSADGAAVIAWQTSLEIDNLGFRLYREEASGERVLITPAIVGGSALFSGATPLTAGRSYRWLDREGSRAKCYWLEDIDLAGVSTVHGPIAVTASDELAPVGGPRLLAAVEGAANSQTLARLGSSGRRDATRVVFTTASAAPGDLSKQWELAGAPAAVRIVVDRAGWYRVTRDRLVAAGFDPGNNLRQLRLFAQGRQQPIHIGSIPRSSRERPTQGRREGYGGDFFEFYGQPLDTPSSGTMTYWLVRQPSEPAKTVDTAPALDGAIGDLTFARTVERRDRSVYLAALRDETRDNFFGPVIGAEAAEQSIDLDQVGFAASSQARLQVALQGASLVPHRVQVSLNGQLLGAVDFAEMENKTAEFPVAQASLKEGANTIRFAADGGATDVSLVDFVRITYWRPFVAVDDSLAFTGAAGRRLTISGFAHNDIRVVDVTDPKNVLELGVVVTKSGDQYSVQLCPVGAAGQERMLYAFRASAPLTPASLELDAPSSWNRKTNQADYVIIAHRDLLSAANQLKAYREGQGYSVAVVDVEDAYDEFSYGVKDPAALRALLARTQAWVTAPRFVLLIGDATQDPRDYLGFGDKDLVPTKWVATVPAKTPSDDWFVDFDDAGFPQLAIGRLPAKTAEEAERMVTKVIGYESGQAGEWTSKALFVNDDGGADEFTFRGLAENLRAVFPGALSCQSLDLGELGVAGIRANLLSALNQGVGFVGYVGHGSIDVWSEQAIFESDDALALENGDRLPVFLMFNCLNGFFADVYSESLAEGLLKAPQGGAAVIVASSSLTDPLGQDAFAQALAGQLFGASGLTIGEAVVNAKRGMTDHDIRKSFILFGDPATQVR